MGRQMEYCSKDNEEEDQLKMASFSSIRSRIFDKEEKKQQYQAHILGLNAYDRHKKFLKDYANFYGGDNQKQENLPIKTDQDTLREGYRFLSNKKVLIKHLPCDRYCVADMSRYKTGKIGLRWRTEKEVKSGKGQFVCGNKHCSEEDGLASYEVNFAYFEAGENKQALVKLVTCERCAKKLLYRKLKEKEKEKEKEEAKFREKEEHRKKREREEADDDTSTVYERSKGKKSSSISAGDGKSNEVDDFDEYLQGMFL
nr:hypothetical protein [Tanacetum cinerariifolium]